jgi:hypothetical protein
LIITDQPDTRAAVDGEPDGRVQGEGVCHPGFVDDDQRQRTDRVLDMAALSPTIRDESG